MSGHPAGQHDEGRNTGGADGGSVGPGDGGPGGPASAGDGGSGGGAGRCRAILSVPATEEKRILRAFDRGADELVFDLEDAVAPQRKDDARALLAGVLAEVLAGPRAGGVGVSVRVNAIRSPWCHLDIAACVGAGDGPLSLVVPKVSDAGDLAFVERLLDGIVAATGRTAPVRVQALIENAEGLSRVAEIAAHGGRLEGLILGYADLGASLGRAPSTPPQRWLYVQDQVLTAARAHGLRAIDGPYLGTADDAGLRAAAEHARELGYDGKWVIHPAQIATVRETFTAGPEEVARARAVLAALEDAHRRGAGAVGLDGEMIDEALAVAARRTLARAQ
ncbi:CoA ester lyase [Frankia sp. AvcI1]|uniref:HpcH/HpaI aldolase/citrate lyase family protein n=1 Tax=Frankia sp. AvcI1 TaxID=573496 RepID=UPI000AA732B3|nr:CoA ester lyase [Frankia sp. AvcI1]